MAEWLLVVSADLRRQGSTVVVGPETARVCRKAAALLEAHPNAALCVPAGYSSRFGVSMGSGPVKQYLTSTCGVDSAKVAAPTFENAPFTTNGEMITFVDFLYKHNDRAPRITVVVRSWHAPRALALLKARLRGSIVRPERIDVVPVQSKDHLGMLLEPLRWVKNIPNL